MSAAHGLLRWSPTDPDSEPPDIWLVPECECGWQSHIVVPPVWVDGHGLLRDWAVEDLRQHVISTWKR